MSKDNSERISGFDYKGKDASWEYANPFDVTNQPGVWYEGSFHPISYGLGPLDNMVDVFVGDGSLIMAGFVIGMGSFLISLGNLFPKTYQKMIIVIPSTVLTIVGIRAFYEIWRYGKGWWPFAHGEWNPVGPLTS